MEGQIGAMSLLLFSRKRKPPGLMLILRFRAMLKLVRDFPLLMQSENHLFLVPIRSPCCRIRDPPSESLFMIESFFPESQFLIVFNLIKGVLNLEIPPWFVCKPPLAPIKCGAQGAWLRLTQEANVTTPLSALPVKERK